MDDNPISIVVSSSTTLLIIALLVIIDFFVIVDVCKQISFFKGSKVFWILLTLFAGPVGWIAFYKFGKDD